MPWSQSMDVPIPSTLGAFLHPSASLIVCEILMVEDISFSFARSLLAAAEDGWKIHVYDSKKIKFTS